MDHKDAIERILRIEDACDVTAIRYGGVALWPYIRMLLWGRLLRPAAYSAAPALGLPEWARRHAAVFQAPANRAAFDRMEAQHRQQMAMLAARPPVDVLFFSRVEDHADTFGGRHYNRHIDPLVATVNGRHSYLKLELATAGTPQTTPRHIPTAFVDSTDYVRFASRRFIVEAFGADRPPPSMPGADAFFDALRRLEPGMPITREQLFLEAEQLRFYRRYFSELLSAVRPRAVMAVCYYYDLAMGLMAASRDFGVPAIDIQHGKQGAYHGMYTHWKHVPDDGYELLPRAFWCWGKESRDNIQRWLPNEAHQTVVGGNRWLAMWTNTGQAPLPIDAADHAFLESLHGHERVVLVSLQPVDPVLPGVLLEAIRSAPPTWRWLLRLHPLQKDTIPACERQLAGLGIGHANLHEATRTPLYALLQKADHHVTQWSSVAYEALAFGIPTSILGQTGATLFDTYIEAGHFAAAPNAAALIAQIAGTAGARAAPPAVPYIEVDDRLADRAIAALLTPAAARPARAVVAGL